MNALDLSYVHATIGDIVNRHKIVDEDNEHITIIYHVITTKPTLVDYGGGNVFSPLFLYKDPVTGTVYYTIALTYVWRLTRGEYYSYFLEKNKEVFKNDTEGVQQQLAISIKSVSEINEFKMLDVNEKCLNVTISEIISNEQFPVSTYSRDITNIIPTIPFLYD